MGTFSLWHWLIVLVVVLVLFGGSGKISSLMGDVAKGIKSFKKGLSDESGDKPQAEKIDTIEHEKAQTLDASGASVKNKAES